MVRATDESLARKPYERQRCDQDYDNLEHHLVLVLLVSVANRSVATSPQRANHNCRNEGWSRDSFQILSSPATNSGRIQCFHLSPTQRGEAFVTCSPRIGSIASGTRVATLVQSSMPFSGCVPRGAPWRPCPQIFRRSIPATSSRCSGAESEYWKRRCRFWKRNRLAHRHVIRPLLICFTPTQPELNTPPSIVRYQHVVKTGRGRTVT
jgi:hypothetical protein